jgi:glycosyltransferase involved in cell wall biosynthesis
VTGPADPHQASALAYVDRLRVETERLGIGQAVRFLGLEAEAAGRGSLPHEVVATLYRIADALLLPSRDEGFGLPILEAALARLPIVCADLPVLREVAGDGALYILPDEDPTVVARRILERIDGDGAARLSRWVRQERRWQAIYRHHLAPFLDRAVSASRGGASRPSAPPEGSSPGAR